MQQSGLENVRICQRDIIWYSELEMVEYFKPPDQILHGPNIS